MSIKAAIVKPLEPGYVQVDVTDKMGYTRNYKAPQKSAKSFSVDIKRQEKDLNLYSNILLFASMIVGIVGVFPFTKKMDSRLNQILVQSASAITLAILTSFGMMEYAESARKKLLDKHQAKEIFYRA